MVARSPPNVAAEDLRVPRAVSRAGDHLSTIVFTTTPFAPWVWIQSSSSVKFAAVIEYASHPSNRRWNTSWTQPPPLSRVPARSLLLRFITRRREERPERPRSCGKDGRIGLLFCRAHVASL